MKKIAIIASIGLTFAAAGTLTAGLISSNQNGIKDSQVQASGETAVVYFNFNEYGKTDANSNHTSFSIWAYGGEVGDSWFRASEVNFDIGVYSIECDKTYTKFRAVRAEKDTWETWPNHSTSYNESGEFYRDSSDKDYCWVWSSNGNYGDQCTWHKTKGTNLNINGVAQEMSFNFANNEYGVTNLSLISTDELTITKDGNTYGYSNLEDKSLFNKATGESNAFMPKNPSTYAIYLKDNGTIWAQIDSGVEAATWAEGFVKGVGCAAPYNAAPKNWDTYVGTFATLTDGAKDTLIGATASNEEGATYVQQAAFIHDMCVRKYAGCDVFMKRDGGGSRTVTPSNSINLVENNGNNYTAIIIIAASVAIVSLSAAFIMLKKRKESR